MGHRTESIERQSQATPFAEDFLAHLQGLLDNQGTGTGPTALQHQSGNAIEKWLETMGDFDQFASPIIDVHNRQTDRHVADQREMFGAQGQRFGSQLARSETDLRGESMGDLNAMLAGLRMQQGQQQLQGIGLMNQIGQSNLMPFMEMARMGILPDEIAVTPNPWMEALQGGLSLGAGFLAPWSMARAGG
jgi:hypothetical protein